MKKVLVAALVTLCFLVPALAQEEEVVEVKEFIVYKDKGSRETIIFLLDGWVIKVKLN